MATISSGQAPSIRLPVLDGKPPSNLESVSSKVLAVLFEYCHAIAYLDYGKVVRYALTALSLSL